MAAHHSALDMHRRRSTEAALKSGRLRAVITSTSLELGVDIGTADLVVQVGLPGSVARCVQRIGRSGHRPGAASRGMLLASTPAELAGAVITAGAATAGRIEPMRMIEAPLDVVCQQLVGMACPGEQSADAAFALFRKTGPMAALSRSDFQACLDYLAGELPGPSVLMSPNLGPGPAGPRPGSGRATAAFACAAAASPGGSGAMSARSTRKSRCACWREESRSARSRLPTPSAWCRAIGLFWMAAHSRPGDSRDRSCSPGRPAASRACPAGPAIARRSHRSWPGSSPSSASMPHSNWSTAGRCLYARWLVNEFDLDIEAAEVLVELFEAQVQWSEVPETDAMLVEESPSPTGDGLVYSFHVPLHRSACEALGRAAAARLGRRIGRNLSLAVADLGWSIRIPGDVDSPVGADTVAPLFDLERLDDDVVEGLDRGQLMARRFRQVAATALMILDNPEPGRRVRVGGLHWASTRLYPLVKTVCPEHPLLRETRREVLDDLLDAPAAAAWLKRQPEFRFRSLPGLSPFAAAWIEPGQGEPLQFESAASALRRLHARLIGAVAEPAS